MYIIVGAIGGSYMWNINDFLKTIPDRLDKLIVYDDIKNDPLIVNLMTLIEYVTSDNPEEYKNDIQKTISKIYKTLFSVAEEYSLNDNIYLKYIYYIILKNENVYSLNAEKYQNVNKSLSYAIVYDFEILYDLLKIDIYNLLSPWSLRADLILSYEPSVKKRYRKITQIEQLLLEPDSPAELQRMVSSIAYDFGCGVLLLSSIFRWGSENKLIPIEAVDSIRFSDLYGIDHQKNIIMKNTSAFINGIPANNILLAGARGTGKSSCVKATANYFLSKGLRIIEIRKTDIQYFPNLIEYLSRRGGKFIIFIDDISFENFEISYKEVKSLLEGGLESISDNILIYATSNRRNIVNEKWTDRTSDDEVFVTDTANEQLSLSDRFGLTLQFLAPSKEDYLKIVSAVAAANGLNPDDEFLEAAENWAQAGKGRSGRTAVQFVKNWKVNM